MPKSCSCDLRQRAIEMVEVGASRHEAAEHFGVAVSSVVKWMQRWNESRSAAPKPRGGSISPLEHQAECVMAVITRQPDLTLVETAAELRSHRTERADVARARRRWIREQGLLDPARLVFLDETAVTTSMVRLRGRAPRGIRVVGRVPLGAWKTITFIAAMRHDKMTAPMALEGAMSGEMFLAYLQQCLCPTLSRGDMVVIDNCRAHMSPRVREVIERTGATTRSRWLTANSSNSSGAPKRERLQRFAERFDRSCRPSVLKNAPIT
jgi:transposase